MAKAGEPAEALAKAGGDEGARTLDLCSAIAALSQLSYIPGIRLELYQPELPKGCHRNPRGGRGLGMIPVASNRLTYSRFASGPISFAISGAESVNIARS